MGIDYKYMVAVRCFSFSHSRFINDTLRGFEMQETTFPVLFLVIDDASEDGEQDILRHWVESNLIAEDGNVTWNKMAYGNVVKGRLRGKPNLTFAFFC